MAQTDSGLGWSCDSNYYIYAEDTYLSTQSAAFYKNSDGAAIAAYVHTSDGWHLPFLVSTVSENVGFKPYNTTAKGNITINGITWYYSNDAYISNGRDTTVNIPYLDVSSDNIGVADKNDLVVKLIEVANVQQSSSPITSTDYVHSYVEGVIKENNKRMITPSILGIPLFSSSTSYLINDYVIKDGNLYKCTTAHSGAWSSGDFTQTSILNIIQNN